MARLSSSERAKLPDRAFAYIDAQGRRRLPINDEPHVRAALGRFERIAFEDDAARERARTRLLKAAKKHDIVPVGFITGQFRSERAARTADLAWLPTGTVTLLMSDIEGSTRLLERLGDRYSGILTEVRRIHRRTVRGGGGHEIDARADEYFACFEEAPAALDAAVAIQRRLGERTWAHGERVRVRMGVHSGRPTVTDAGYVGLSVHTVSRLCSVGHGGQVIVSARVREVTGATTASGIRLRSMGVHRLHGLSGEHALFAVQAEGLPSRFPPLRI